MTTESALLAAVLANPDDDLPRLVYADWFEENGQPERSDFVRWCVNEKRDQWVDGYWIHDGVRAAGYGHRVRSRVVRGFVHEVRCPLAVWCGGVCPGCNGTKRIRDSNGRFLGACPACGGTGLITGIGPSVVRSHPLTRVILTDREPIDVEMTDGQVLYAYTFGRTDIGVRHVLPDDLHQHFPPPVELDITSPDSVNAALSSALIRWAKSQPHPATLTTSPVHADLTAR